MKRKPKILLLTPPFVQLNTPYPATPTLTGFLRSRGYRVEQRDLSIETALAVLRMYGDELTDEFLEILQNPALPPEAKRGAAEYMDSLAESIREEIDEDFGFSRYAEKLGTSLPDFSAVLARLRRRSAVDRILEELVADLIEELRPDCVGVTCPFPGTLLGAFRIAKTVKRLAPSTVTVLGGGYVNTELRDMTDRRPYRFFDCIMLDDGCANWLELLEGRCACDVPPFIKPDYSGLDMSLYFDVPETDNPMHRLWSCGKWIKFQLARGCYWRKCAFCDVTLDYIKRFEMPDAATVVDAMQELGVDFHFTDEALPPVLVEKVCREIIRRGFKCRWWGNIRFDRSYTPELARLMARAGCIAVTGGLECAHDRLLKLMNKGITLASAREALRSFRDAGIMAHAYLMYAFPTETEREARLALSYVRGLFRENLVQSAFFHRFALTVHSPVFREPERFGIEVPDLSEMKAGRLFALNEVPYAEASAPDWDSIGRALKLALYNYMEGRGLSKSAAFWFNAVKLHRA
jgi:hypothetical protein